MTNAASTSNPSCIIKVDEVYPYPSHVIAPNFVTTKLSGKDTYNVWETQILCLLKSHHVFGFVKGLIPSPAGNGKGKGKEDDDIDAWIASDSLVKGWILGSLSDGVAKKVVNRLKPKDKNTDFTAKDVWDELQRSYGPWVGEQAAEMNSISEDAKSKYEPTEEKTRKEEIKRWVYNYIIEGTLYYVTSKLREADLKPWDKLTNNGNTVLHVAVGSYTKNPEILNILLEMTLKEIKLLDLINSDGSTLLHVAAIGGNIEAVNMLVERNPELLLATDKESHTPLALSISNMHTKTSHCLFEHMKVYRYLLEEKEKEYDALLRGEVIMTCKTFEQQEKKYGDLNTGISGEDINTSKCLLEQQEKEYDALFTGKSGEELVVLAISCQDLSLAKKIIKDYPDAILDDSDAVLTALAQNFPRAPYFWERGFREEYMRIAAPYMHTVERIWNCYQLLLCCCLPLKILILLFLILLLGLCLLATLFYQFGKVLVRPFTKDASQIYLDATNLSYDVHVKIWMKGNSSTYHRYYNSSIFEATRPNSSTFIRCIMRQFPDAIWSTNEDGHNFIQYSVTNRSEKIYNLLYEMSEHKNIYKTIKDSSGNNLLHLAARLAPTNKLNLISGAALQIQRELQWFKEVERFACPLNRIQKNLDGDTPQEVFTREHKDLVNEGENWIKKTAESYTITAALIITIVFAAAITVPGGNNQELGVPIFTNNIAFTVFAISDAISLFTAVTSLLLFLSILTAHFAEQDFLLKLPTKLIIGLTMLFLSTTAMIIAFGATLFLVFGQGNSSMLIPIGALTCLPITSFVTLQFPLIVELIHATYCGGFFVKERYRYFY